VLAGFFGVAALDATKQSKTRVVTDRALVRHKISHRDALGLSLVGVRVCKVKKKRNRGEDGPRSDPDEARASDRRSEAAHPFISSEAVQVGEDDEEDLLGDEDDFLYDGGVGGGGSLSVSGLRTDGEEEEEEEEEGDHGGPPADDPEHGLEEDERLQLLYALSVRDSKAKLRNVLQLSASILSWSKIIFFDKILFILQVADEEKLEIMYTGA
jgi:hypothetical protein